MIKLFLAGFIAASSLVGCSYPEDHPNHPNNSIQVEEQTETEEEALSIAKVQGPYPYVIHMYTDTNGCQYLVTRKGGMVERKHRNGMQVCSGEAR